MIDTIEKIKKEKIIAIFRGLPLNYIRPTVEALFKGGIRLIEIPFNQKDYKKNDDYFKSIQIIADEYKEITVGAGTVMNKEQLLIAKAAGAKYLLSPHTDVELIKEIKKEELVAIPGSITPSECIAAYNAGADFVKLFPIGNFGEKYLKAILSPINHIPFLCVGGINKTNIPELLKYGANGFGIGENLVNTELILAGKFDEIENLAREYYNATHKIGGCEVNSSLKNI